MTPIAVPMPVRPSPAVRGRNLVERVPGLFRFDVNIPAVAARQAAVGDEARRRRRLFEQVRRRLQRPACLFSRPGVGVRHPSRRDGDLSARQRKETKSNW